MIVIRALLSAVVLFSCTSITQAQELYTVPDDLQALANHYKLANRMHMAVDPGNEQVGLYFGVLAAADVLAAEIASQRGVSRRTVADLTAALWTLCYVPPNKPPPADPDKKDPKERAKALAPALIDDAFRHRLRHALGERPVQIAIKLNAILPQRPDGRTVALAFERGVLDEDYLVRRVPEFREAASSKDFNWGLVK